MSTVTFETKVWEKDWRYILNGNYLETIISRCNYPFDKKVLFINNVKDKELVIRKSQQKVEEGVIDEFYFVEDYAQEALIFFNILKSSFKGGYYYSIAELVSIYLCKTDYLLHFSGDAYLQKSAKPWINNAIEKLKSNENFVIANACWNFKFEEAKQEAYKEIEQFYIGQGCSDQCYLIETDRFRKKDIYNEKHPASDRYPKYGGELFEKRVDSFLRNNDLYRITSKETTYIHKNFSKNKLIQKTKLLRNIYLQLRLKK